MTDLILLIVFLLSLLYCCDCPVLWNLTFLVADHDSVAYSVGLSIIAAYIIYVIQTLPGFIKRKWKYNRYIEWKLKVIDNLMADTIRILAHFREDDSAVLREIKANLRSKKFFEDEAPGELHVYQNREELPIIQALLNNEMKIHDEISQLIPLNILGKKTVALLLDIEQLPLRDFARKYAEQPPGDLKTIQQQAGKSAGGALSYNMAALNRDLLEIMRQYVKVQKKVQAYRDALSGSGIRVIISNLRL